MLALLKDSTEALQAVITALALIIGGLWTYLIFVRRRQRFPRATLQQAVSCRRVAPDYLLLSIDLTVANAGEVLLTLAEASIVVQQVLPALHTLRGAAEQARRTGCEALEVLTWPTLVAREEQWPAGAVEIEPGERHELHYDLLVATSVETVRIVSHVRNRSKRRPLWWGTTLLHDLGATPSAADPRPLALVLPQKYRR